LGFFLSPRPIEKKEEQEEEQRLLLTNGCVNEFAFCRKTQTTKTKTTHTQVFLATLWRKIAPL
jgi:hypothetical protein